MSSGQGTGHYDQIWSKSDVGKYVKKTCCQKKIKKKGETSKIQKPAGDSGRLKMLVAMVPPFMQ